MKIYTIWDHEDPKDMPWLVTAVSEYVLDEYNGQLPDFYKKELDTNRRRELVIEIPDAAVVKLFTPLVVKGEVKEE